MKTCAFCDKSITKPNSGRLDTHDKCDAEYYRRVDDFQCVCCGNSFEESDYEGLAEGDVAHKGCTEYLDYPGESN